MTVVVGTVEVNSYISKPPVGLCSQTRAITPLIHVNVYPFASPCTTALSTSQLNVEVPEVNSFTVVSPRPSKGAIRREVAVSGFVVVPSDTISPVLCTQSTKPVSGLMQMYALPIQPASILIAIAEGPVTATHSFVGYSAVSPGDKRKLSHDDCIHR